MSSQEIKMRSKNLREHLDQFLSANGLFNLPADIPEMTEWEARLLAWSEKQNATIETLKKTAYKLRVPGLKHGNCLELCAAAFGYRRYADCLKEGHWVVNRRLRNATRI